MNGETHTTNPRSYPRNAQEWEVDTLVIHAGDAKVARMLMRVIEVRDDGKFVTEYINPELKEKWEQENGNRWVNNLGDLLEIGDFPSLMNEIAADEELFGLFEDGEVIPLPDFDELKSIGQQEDRSVCSIPGCTRETQTDICIHMDLEGTPITLVLCRQCQTSFLAGVMHGAQT